MAKVHLIANTFHIKELFKLVATHTVSESSLRPARILNDCFIYRSMCDRTNNKREDIFCQYCILYNKIWFVTICLLEGVFCLIKWSVYILRSL